MNLQGVTSSNGSFFGLVKVHATAPTKGSRAESTIHSVRSPDWRDAKSYVQSPNSWSGNVFPHLGNTGASFTHTHIYDAHTHTHTHTRFLQARARTTSL